MLIKGTEAKPFEAYGVSPSTKYPSKIENVEGNINVTVCNKNLYDKNNPNILDTVIDVNGIGTNSPGTYKTIWIPCKPNTTYTISKKYDQTKNRFAVAYSNIEPDYSQMIEGYTYNLSADTITITTGEDAKYLLAYVWITGSTLTYQEMLDSIQIEENNSKTDFIENNQQVKTFPLQQNQKMLEGSETKDDGIHHIRKQIEFDGTENFQIRNTNEDGISTFSLSTITDYKHSSDLKALSSHFKNLATVATVGAMYSKEEGFSFYYTSSDETASSFYINSPHATLEEFKAYLAQQKQAGTPVIVEYELAEEEIEEYTEEQQEEYDELQNLSSYKTVTNVFTDKGLLEFTYTADTKTYVDNEMNNKYNQLAQQILKIVGGN